MNPRESQTGPQVGGFAERTGGDSDGLSPDNAEIVELAGPFNTKTANR